MNDVLKAFTNPETAKRFETVPDFNWNRNVHIPIVYGGPIRDIPPHVAEKMIEQGRKDIKAKSDPGETVTD